MALSREERDDMVISLNMRINHIETGDIHRSAEMVEKLKEGKIKALSESQMEAILRMKNLVRKLLNGHVC